MEKLNFQQPLLQYDLSGLILTCWFAVKETFLIIKFELFNIFVKMAKLFRILKSFIKVTLNQFNASLLKYSINFF